MTKADKPIASLIEHEVRIRNTYRDLLSDTVQSNIRYFLTLFLNSHNSIIGKLKSYGKEYAEEGQDEILSPAVISATDHLESEKDVDLNSLQSVLLFLAKTESDSLNEFDALMHKAKDSAMRAYLTRIKEEKEIITTKADRLYHDMIESKIS